MANSGDLSTDSSAYNIEFRSTVDDGWYSVRLLLNDETLTINFWQFSETFDEKFNAGDFETPEAVDEFCRRFRPVSEQVQDSQCSRISEGMTVCASIESRDKDDIRFYDAVVEAVHNEKHSSTKREDECFCTFVLFWQHGPNEGNLTSASIADICQIQSGAPVDSKVASFSKLAKEKIEMVSLKSISVSNGNMLSCKGSTYDKESCSSIKTKSCLPQNRFQEMESAREFVCVSGRIGKCCQQCDHDRDMGGESFNKNSIDETGSHRFITIENLEKNLSASSIMEFIHKQTSMSPQAYVFTGLPSESYTRGVVVVDCKMKLKKIYEFLSNPDHIIMSLTGRPWVITEKILRRGTFKTTLGSLMPKSQYLFENKNVDHDIKVVRSGTDEYMKAKRLRDLFMDFLDHQRRLHKRLALEERMILQAADAI